MEIKIQVPDRAYKMLVENGESGSAAEAIITEYINDLVNQDEEDFTTTFKTWCVDNFYI